MLQIQLDVQPTTEKRLKKLLDNVEDQEIFAQNFINYQISELHKSLFNISVDLKNFENKYNLTTDRFYAEYQEGKIGDDEDYMIWAGIYEMYQDNEKKLQELS
jgi:chromosome segregation and condensation protein ScpB